MRKLAVSWRQVDADNVNCHRSLTSRYIGTCVVALWPSIAIPSARMEKIFDLPAHPLLVHTPVVLAPIICLALIAALVRPTWRERIGRLPLWASIVLTVAMFMAKESGEKFEEGLVADAGFDAKAIHKHAELGDQTFLLTVLLLIVVAAVTGYAWRSTRPTLSNDSTGSSSLPRWLLPVLSAGATVVSVLVVIWTIRTGHEGAKVVWDGVLR